MPSLHPRHLWKPCLRTLPKLQRLLPVSGRAQVKYFLATPGNTRFLTAGTGGLVRAVRVPMYTRMCHAVPQNT